MIAIACLSQKGGVGKSTIARLIAKTYAAGGWRVKIADFNVKQKTSVDWAALRMSQGIEPEIAAEAYTDVTRAVNQSDLDLVVFDGKPDADTQTIRLAQQSDLVIVPTGVSADDLVPQVRFAQELKMRGIIAGKIFFVLNKVTDSTAAIADAKRFIQTAGYEVATTTLPMKTAFVNAQNSGRALSESEFPSLNDRAEALAAEIISHVNNLTGVSA
jgi:chromosome partitioning protein